MTVPFTFQGSTVSLGKPLSGASSTERMHPLLPTTVLGTNAYTLLLNGWNMNRRMTDVLGYDGSANTAVLLLQMTAPSAPLTPLISQFGTGRVFGTGYRWRYRWKNSRTGEFSGLSPNPTFNWNLGVETPIGADRYLGQTAFFYLPTDGAPDGTDTLQLFRNSSAQTNVWYLVAEKTTVGATYVYFKDDTPDDELFLAAELVDTENPSGASFAEGPMPPLCKAYAHPSGRTFYFGVLRFGKTAQFTCSATVGSSRLNAGTSSIIERGRVGQRFRLVDPTDDPTAYRVVAVTGEGLLDVWPEVKKVNGSNQVVGQIEDDRDARGIWMSEPGRPWLIDPLKTIFVGEDFDDGVLHVFSLNGLTYVQTYRKIYRLLNDLTEDPSLSVFIQVAAEEGTTGFQSGCETPFGWVYVHPQLGIRLFDGQSSSPLGGDSPIDHFAPLTQFQAMSRESLASARVCYDWEQNLVLVCYVPTGQGSLNEVLAYDQTTETWRGPWRQRLLVGASMRSASKADSFVCGDDFGNLYQNGQQVLDLTPAGSSGTLVIHYLSGNLTYGNGDITAVAADRGSPIWFTRPSTGVSYFSRIASRVNSTTVDLLHLPVSLAGAAITVTQPDTYKMGAIFWSAETAYLDAGEPIHPKKTEELWVRFKRGTATQSFEAGVSVDDDGLWIGETTTGTTAPVTTADSNGVVYAQMRLQTTGHAIKLRVRGLSTTGDPRITTAILDTDIQSGVL